MMFMRCQRGFFRLVIFTVIVLLSPLSAVMTSVALPSEVSNASSPKPIWQNATVLSVTGATYITGSSSVPRRSERYTLSTQAGIYEVESRTGWARNKAPRLTAGRQVQLQRQGNQILLKTANGRVYPMVMAPKTLNAVNDSPE